MTIEQAQASNRLIINATHKVVVTRLVWGIIWVFSTILFAAIQLSLGTEKKIVVMAFLSLLCCLLPLFLFGINDISAVFIFILLTKYSFFPLWIKTLLGERIDVGLIAPFNTFAIAIAGSVIALIALLLAKFVSIKKRILRFSFTNRQILAAGYLASGFGLFFLNLHTIYSTVTLSSGETIQGFGGFGSLLNLLYFGIVCLTVISMKSNTNQIHKVFLLLILLLVMFFSLRSNAKSYLTFSVLAFVLTIFYCRITIKIHYLIYLSAFVAFYFFVFAPIIHLTRTPAFKAADLSGKIFIVENLFKSYAKRDLIDDSNKTNNLPYYASVGTILVDRFEMITDLDIVAGGIYRGNSIGWVPLIWAVESSLPSFLFHNKPEVSDIDLIAYNAGYFPELTRLYHTIGVFGSAYAMFLWPSLIFVSLSILTAYLLLLRVIVKPSLRNNLFGIFFLASYGFNFSEQSVQALLGAIIRSIPFDVILIMAILIVVTYIYPYLSESKKDLQK